MNAAGNTSPRLFARLTGGRRKHDLMPTLALFTVAAGAGASQANGIHDRYLFENFRVSPQLADT